jgi:hypothetical protein
VTETARREVLDAVGEDTDLLPEEKETTLRLGKQEDHAEVYTAEAGLARRLLAHPAVAVAGVTVLDGDARREQTLDEYDGGRIVGVRARLPVGVLQVKLRERGDAGHAEIVTDRVLEEVDDE